MFASFKPRATELYRVCKFEFTAFKPVSTSLASFGLSSAVPLSSLLGKKEQETQASAMNVTSTVCIRNIRIPDHDLLSESRHDCLKRTNRSSPKPLSAGVGETYGVMWKSGGELLLKSLAIGGIFVFPTRIEIFHRGEIFFRNPLTFAHFLLNFRRVTVFSCGDSPLRSLRNTSVSFSADPPAPPMC